VNTSDLELFIRVAESGGLSAAAREINISPAVASAGIKRLEKELGAILFIRSTRKLRLSDAGIQYLQYCKRAISDLQKGANIILKNTGLIAGHISISLPSDLGRNFLLNCLEEFTEKNPLLTLTIKIDDRISDFYSDCIDIAIRYGDLEDSTMIAFKLITTERVLCASPEYIKRHGDILHPDDLKEHNCLLFMLEDKVFNSWVFSSANKEKITVNVKGDRVANDSDIVRKWAISGHGIALKSRLDINKEVKDGTLNIVLQDYKSDPLDMWLVCPNRSLLTPTVIALKNYLKVQLQELS
jgi:DNA-binding transcriptional LysR family regulator